MVNLRIDKKRVAEILQYINDKDAFVVELVEAIDKSIREGNPRFLETCLVEWEASAELNSIPGFSKKVWKRYEKLARRPVVIP